VTRGAGTMTVEAPRVRDGREDHRLPSAILPPYMRRSPKLAEGLPVLSLRGLSTGDFKPALVSLLGEEATAGLSPTPSPA
jgi:putative transposase